MLTGASNSQTNWSRSGLVKWICLKILAASQGYGYTREHKMWCINDWDQENRIIQVLQMRCWSDWQCRKRPNVTVLSPNLISYRHCYCRSDLGDQALPSWRGPGSVWQLLGWADGPRNYNFKWHQILREELCFGVRGQLEMRCPTWRMTEERRGWRGKHRGTLKPREEMRFSSVHKMSSAECGKWEKLEPIMLMWLRSYLGKQGIHTLRTASSVFHFIKICIRILKLWLNIYLVRNNDLCLPTSKGKCCSEKCEKLMHLK